MMIRDIFRFREGRTVLVGSIEDGPGYVPPGVADIYVDGEKRAQIRIEGEMTSCGPLGETAEGLRAISTSDTRCLDHDSIKAGRWELRSSVAKWRNPVHRHLLGIESPPPDYVADPMSQGPVLPEGWDGDAWVDPLGQGYFLRGWNKRTSRIAYGTGQTYEAARKKLLDDVARGHQRAEIVYQGTGATEETFK
jgi:hypothetical protein